MSNIAGALYRVTKIANEMKCRESVETFILSHTVKPRIVAGSRIQAGPRIQAGGSSELYQ